MADDMVKKSVDITQEDEEWLEDSFINFSKFVRRKIAERRAESIRDWKKERIYNQIDGMAAKGQELMKEWKQEKKELQEEYEVEVVDQEYTHVLVRHEDNEYTMHWRPDTPFEDSFNEPSETVEEFGQKFMDAWFDKLDCFGEYVEEETEFEIVGGDEATQDFEGQGTLSEFNLYAPYLPTDQEDFTIKFESRIDLEIRDIEKSVKSEF